MKRSALPIFLLVLLIGLLVQGMLSRLSFAAATEEQLLRGLHLAALAANLAAVWRINPDSPRQAVLVLLPVLLSVTLLRLGMLDDEAQGAFLVQLSPVLDGLFAIALCCRTARTPKRLRL